jgi:hypothetical protein
MAMCIGIGARTGGSIVRQPNPRTHGRVHVTRGLEKEGFMPKFFPMWVIFYFFCILYDY